MKTSKRRDSKSKYTKFYQESTNKEPYVKPIAKKQAKPREFNAKSVMELALERALKNLKK